MTINTRAWLVHSTALMGILSLSLGCGQHLESDLNRDTQDNSTITDKEHSGTDVSPVDRITENLNLAVDEHRKGVDAWVNVTRIDRSSGQSDIKHFQYGDTADRKDFWPASTIKMFTATAGLELLTEWGFTIDAVATFYYQNQEGEWIEDTSMSFRELVRRTFDCSSNITYTLLLRLAGVDWLNQTFFPKYGMTNTALMRGYMRSTDRPYGYQIWVPQRIVITDAGRTVERIHTYSGVSHAENAGCSIWNGSGMGNCSSPRDMSEHLRRLIMHHELPPSERFDIRNDLIDWYRGDGADLVLNNIAGDDCGGPVLEGVRQVFDSPQLYHKEGLVSEYRGSIHYVKDEPSQTEYVAAIMLKSPSAQLLAKVTEEVGRVMRDDGNYVHLGSLRDYVNPVQANLIIQAEESGTLEVKLKPYHLDPYSPEGWFTPAGFDIAIASGMNAYSLESGCQDFEGTYHVQATLKDSTGAPTAQSDLHYVIVENDGRCDQE